MIKLYDITTDLNQELYEEILNAGAKTCDFALLVRRPNLELSLEGNKFLKEVEAHLSCVEDKSEWPGTQLIGHKAVIYTYTLSPEFVAIIKKKATSLYQWHQPELLEDLCLLRKDGTAWLTTIAHEQEAYFSLTDKEHEVLSKAIPQLLLKQVE